ncbi:unnamed protein product, partial [Acanthoscelides obtectus]
SQYKGGGTALYIRKTVSTKSIDLTNFCVGKQIELCASQFKDNGITTIIIVCYRSPSGDIKVFYDKLGQAIHSVYQPYHHIILCGDFNIDYYNQGTESGNLNSVLSEFNLSPSVGWPTRIGRSSVTTIDQIFTNFEDSGTSCALENNMSHHRTVFFEFHQNISTKNKPNT